MLAPAPRIFDPWWAHCARGLRMLALLQLGTRTIRWQNHKVFGWTVLQYPQRTLGGRRPSHKNSGLNFKRGLSAYFSCTPWAGQLS